MTASNADAASSAGRSPAWHTLAYGVVALLLATMSIAGEAPQWWQWMAVALVLPAGVLGVLRRREQPLLLPVVGLAGVLAGVNGFLAVGLFSLALRRRDRTAVLLACLAALATLVQVLVFRRSLVDELNLQNPMLSVLTWAALCVIQVGLPVVAGGWLGSHRDLVASLRERAAAAEAERELRAREAVLQERERMAREMHDSLGHRLALVAMHAGALELTAGQGEQQVLGQAELIRTVARQGLADLRELVGALGTSEAHTRTPQAGLADVPALVAASRRAGSRIKFTDTLDAAHAVPEAAGRAVHRIVQEALTNAHRHAPGEPVSVRLTGAPGQGIEVVVTNPLPAAPQPAGSGTGLAGIAERARLLGGSLVAGPAGGEFVVHARLPWPAEVAL